MQVKADGRIGVNCDLESGKIECDRFVDDYLIVKLNQSYELKSLYISPVD